MLKPLDHAIRDGDPIRAVIANSGVNQDGKTQGITQPNGQAQEALIRDVYENARLDPQECGFVEMHGTGTKVGDPIETQAVYGALAKGRSPRDPLFIGSVKSNVGHLEGASGVVSVIKAAMMLERDLILPNADFQKPNKNIPFDEWNMKVSYQLLPSFLIKATKLMIVDRWSHVHAPGPAGRSMSAYPTTVSAVPMHT